MRPLLLALRFALELALLAAAVVVAGRGIGGAIGWVVGVAAALLVATVWGLLLSPRRRVDVPLPARVGVEMLLFVAAGAGLAAVGLPGWGLVLVVVEVVVVAALWALGLPPGTHVGPDPSAPARG